MKEGHMAEQGKTKCVLCGMEHGSTIGEAVARNSTVQACMRLHLKGEVSYEEALILAVVHLVRANRRINALLEETAGGYSKEVVP